MIGLLKVRILRLAMAMAAASLAAGCAVETAEGDDTEGADAIAVDESSQALDADPSAPEESDAATAGDTRGLPVTRPCGLGCGGWNGGWGPGFGGWNGGWGSGFGGWNGGWGSGFGGWNGVRPGCGGWGPGFGSWNGGWNPCGPLGPNWPAP